MLNRLPKKPNCLLSKSVKLRSNRKFTVNDINKKVLLYNGTETTSRLVTSLFITKKPRDFLVTTRPTNKYVQCLTIGLVLLLYMTVACRIFSITKRQIKASLT